MKKLLLTSTGFENPKIGEEFLKLVNKTASEIKIIFITAAARTKIQLSFAEKTKKEILDLGTVDQNIKTLDLDHSVLYKEVNGFDVIFVCSGNTSHLLDRVRKSGFDKIIKQFVKKGGIYVGVSAGSIIVGPSIEIANVGNENKIDLEDLTGLNLTDISISPHFTEKDRKEIEELKKRVNYSIIPLTDSQAIVILDGKVREIGD